MALRLTNPETCTGGPGVKVIKVRRFSVPGGHTYLDTGPLYPDMDTLLQDINVRLGFQGPPGFQCPML